MLQPVVLANKADQEAVVTNAVATEEEEAAITVDVVETEVVAVVKEEVVVAITVAEEEEINLRTRKVEQ